jgi:hypothetical protein
MRSVGCRDRGRVVLRLEAAHHLAAELVHGGGASDADAGQEVEVFAGSHRTAAFLPAGEVTGIACPCGHSPVVFPGGIGDGGDAFDEPLLDDAAALLELVVELRRREQGEIEVVDGVEPKPTLLRCISATSSQERWPAAPTTAVTRKTVAGIRYLRRIGNA